MKKILFVLLTVATLGLVAVTPAQGAVANKAPYCGTAAQYFVAAKTTKAAQSAELAAMVRAYTPRCTVRVTAAPAVVGPAVSFADVKPVAGSQNTQVFVKYLTLSEVNAIVAANTRR